MLTVIDYLATETGIGDKSLIEKDLFLHLLLYELSKDRFFKENLVFKGGTCLIKCYLGYYRFSEDLDFTSKKDFTGTQTWRNINFPPHGIGNSKSFLEGLGFTISFTMGVREELLYL